MFYRRKFYIVRNDFVETFNKHFNETNLPNQMRHGARLIGRWMREDVGNTTEIFAIWEYDSYDSYTEIEANIKTDAAHVERIKAWYEKHGGRNHVLSEYLLEVKNEALVSTLNEET